MIHTFNVDDLVLARDGSVREAGGRAVVRDTIKAVSHHYSDDKSARGALVTMTKKGIVPGLRVEQEGRALLFVVDVTEAGTP